MHAWGITDGSAGMVAQVKALALALSVSIDMKTVKVRTPYVWFPNAVHSMFLKGYIYPSLIDESTSDPIAPPWPDVIISCGRRSAIVTMGLKEYIKRQHTRHPPRFIHIQDPQVDSSNFDLVVAMDHDSIEGENVLKTQYALHAVTPDVLLEAEEKFASRFAQYPEPYYAVLLGGSTNRYTLKPDDMMKVISELHKLLGHIDGSLLITPSRRTGEHNIQLLKDAFAGHARVYVYDGREENPYLGLLALAERVVVTNDSVNMMTEAMATGKPVYILPLPGHENTKPARFAHKLLQEGIARPLEDPRSVWTYTIPSEMYIISAQIWKKLLTDVPN